jgi:hypothetical protein
MILLLAKARQLVGQLVLVVHFPARASRFCENKVLPLCPKLRLITGCDLPFACNACHFQ